MKILLLNGSPHAEGCTFTGLREMERIFQEEGFDTELIHVGHLPIHGCTVCGRCAKLGHCAYNDMVNEVSEKFREADGLVLGSPVYYASIAGTFKSFLDRLFMSSSFDKTMKVGAAIASARRAGTICTYDDLNKYFGISGMPIATSQYWNEIHGGKASDVSADEEGLQTMRTLARNMSFLIRSIALGRERYGLPDKEPHVRTNFVR